MCITPRIPRAAPQPSSSQPDHDMSATPKNDATTPTAVNALRFALHRLRVSRPTVTNQSLDKSNCSNSAQQHHRHPHHHHDEMQNNAMNLYQQKQATRLHEAYLNLYHAQFKRTYWKSPNGTSDLLGCEHYARSCKLYAKCCNLWVSCRRCHDEALGDDHKLDRHGVEKVLCMHCMTEQPVSEQCVRCDARFAKYFCSTCNFFEDAPNRPVYHCEHCGICRRGRGLGIDNFHCHRCDACVSIETRDHHNCVQRGLHTPCPVCLEDMFTSTEESVYMRCGHSMHASCFREYTKTSFKCPYCATAITDMSEYYRRIDDIMQDSDSDTATPTPAQGQVSDGGAMATSEPMGDAAQAASTSETQTRILCNDCGKRSVVRLPLHAMYHKCAATDDGCGTSYNTRIIGGTNT